MSRTPYPWAFQDVQLSVVLPNASTISFDHWVIIVSIFLRSGAIFWTLVGQGQYPAFNAFWLKKGAELDPYKIFSIEVALTEQNGYTYYLLIKQ